MKKENMICPGIEAIGPDPSKCTLSDADVTQESPRSEFIIIRDDNSHWPTDPEDIADAFFDFPEWVKTRPTRKPPQSRNKSPKSKRAQSSSRSSSLNNPIR